MKPQSAGRFSKQWAKTSIWVTICKRGLVKKADTGFELRFLESMRQQSVEPKRGASRCPISCRIQKRSEYPWRHRPAVSSISSISTLASDDPNDRLRLNHLLRMHIPMESDILEVFGRSAQTR